MWSVLTVKLEFIQIAKVLYSTIHPSFLSDDKEDLFGFQSHVSTYWDECWRTCFEAWGYISLCKAFALSSLPHHPPQPISLLSRAAAIASSVYSSYCMTYTWRVCSLFIFGTPTAWVQLSAVCITSATVSSLTFLSSCTHRRSHCVHSYLGALWKGKGQIKQALCLASVFTLCKYICVNAFVCVCVNLYVKGSWTWLSN